MVASFHRNGQVNTDSISTTGEYAEMNSAQNALAEGSEPNNEILHSTLASTHAQLIEILKELPEQASKQETRMDKVSRYLNSERPFKVATVAVTGAGKSTLLNAMLARDLVLVKNVGGAATGCALHLQQDVADTEREYATVIYRDEENIRELVLQHFIKAYQQSDLILPDRLDGGFAMAIAQSQPGRPLSESEDKTFKDLKTTLARLVQEYASQGARDLEPGNFFLDIESDRTRLQALTDEGSPQNQGSQRKIGLVKRVDYHLKQGKANALKLPDNVCLVDLPGLNGTCLHDIIIRQGIEDADAVLFLVHPRRLEMMNNDELLSRIGRFVSSDRNSQSAERIFCVINCKDEVIGSMEQVLPAIEAAAHKFLEKTIPGSGQHAQQFIVAAWPALQAQKALRDEAIEDPSKYAGIQRTFEIADGDHVATLEKSDIPHLVAALNKFVKTTAERQVRSARQELGYILEDIITEQKTQQSSMMKGTSPQYQRRTVKNIFDERQEQAKDLLIDFRRSQISFLSSLEQQLYNASSVLCDEIDEVLKRKMPKYWKNNFHNEIYPPTGERVAIVNHEPFLGQVEVRLWQLVDSRIETLAQEIVRSYEEAVDFSNFPAEVCRLSSYKIEQAQLRQVIQDEIDIANSRLSQSVRGLAICRLVNSKNQFLPNDEEHIDRDRISSDELLSLLKESDLFAKDLDSTKFNDFMQAVRSHYGHLIQKDCISSLLDLYRYEMIRIEENVTGFLQDRFDDLRDAQDITLDDLELDESIYERWQMLEVIERRMRNLESLKEQLDTSVSIS